MFPILIRSFALSLAGLLTALALATPAVADRRPQSFQATASVPVFDSGDPLTLNATLPGSRAGQDAVVDLQTSLTTWRTVGRSKVGADGSLAAPVDSLLGNATYRISVGPRWNRTVSRPVAVYGRLKVEWQPGQSSAVISGQVITPVRRPITLESYNGGAEGSTLQRGETDDEGRFDFTEAMDHDLELMSITLPAVTTEDGVTLPPIGSGATVRPNDRMVGRLPVGTAGRPYRASVLLYPDAAPPADLSLGSGPLPPGLSFDADTGVISGTPTVAGSYAISVNADRSYPFLYDLAIGRDDDPLLGRISNEPPYGYAVEDVSADARYVLQTGPSSLLGNAGRQVYLWDRRTGVREPLVRSTAGGPPLADSRAQAIDLSSTGRFALFGSADRLVPGDSTSAANLYLFDRVAGSLTRVYSTTRDESLTGSVSADGTVVAISRSSYDNERRGLVSDDLVWTRGAGVQQVHTSFNSYRWGGGDGPTQLSDDGRFVTYQVREESADELRLRVEQLDLRTGATVRLPAAGGDDNIVLKTASADGGRVIVEHGDRQVAVWSRRSGQPLLVPNPPHRVPGNGYLWPHFGGASASGQYLVLFAQEEHAETATWRYDLATGRMQRIEGGRDVSILTSIPYVSDDGTTVVLDSVFWRLGSATG